MMFQENTEKLKTEAEGLLSSQVDMIQQISCSYIPVSDINQGLQCEDSLNDAHALLDGREEHSALKEDQGIPADQKLPHISCDHDAVTICVHCLINQYREHPQINQASEIKKATMGAQEKNAQSKENVQNNFLFHQLVVKNGSRVDHITPECNRLFVMKVIFALCLLWTLFYITVFVAL